jgi:basic membrane protein A
MESALRSSTTLLAGAVVLSLGLTACSSSSPSGGGGSTGGATGSSGSSDAVKVGIAYDTGGLGDGTFNDLAAKGLGKAKSDLGVQIKELSPKQDGSNRADLLRQLADGGYNPIIGVGFSYGTAVDTVAKEYQNVAFIRIDGDPSTVSNVAVQSFREQEGSFLVGAAAALKTKTNHIGFIGGNESALITKFFAGYKQGALAINPSIAIDDKRLASGNDSKGFGDIPGAKVAAQAQYQNGADVIYTAAGGSYAGSFPAAVEAGKWAIGVDNDQYQTVTDAAQKKIILTSMFKKVDTAVYTAVKAFKDNGKVASAEYGLKEDGVGYATSGGYVDDIKPKLDDYKQQIISGQITVKTTP